MAVSIKGAYTGGKNTRLIHGPSGAQILTDAPRDNGGDGSAFSPTDLVAAALGSCMMTILALAGDRLRVNLEGMTMRVDKHMQSEPRRIGTLALALHLPASLSEENRGRLEGLARLCPVAQSLHPEVKVSIEFVYDVVPAA